MLVIPTSESLSPQPCFRNASPCSPRYPWCEFARRRQGLPQHIHFVFPHEIPATHVALTFQGGFSGTAAGVWIATGPPGGKQRTKVDLGLVFGGKIHPQDGNAVSRRVCHKR